MTIDQPKDQRGFTLAELLVAMMCTIIVLGGAVALTAQIQNGYRRQLEDSVGEQEARYALEWIGRYLRSVGNNPFNAIPQCPTAATTFEALTPNVTTGALTLRSDSNPPDGLIGGALGACVEQNENVTISLNPTLHEIQFIDQGAGGTTNTTRTDAVIDGLDFSYLDIDHNPMTAADAAATPGNIYYVQTVITLRTRTGNTSTGTTTRTVSSEIRVRAR